MLDAPFPYFGGKARIADRVWSALGQPEHYLEPFFGSGAVLLRRPHYDPTAHTETVNDADSWLCNVWRAIQYQLAETATWADWPVNHDDLRARRKVLLENEGYLREHLAADDMWCDPKLAGYWIWAASCWIGAGLTCLNAKPHLTDKGNGVHKVSLAGPIPHLSGTGMGVHRLTGGPIHDWFGRLSARLRRVRVVCGDWMQICGGDWQDKTWPVVGMFFDPPYGVEDRDSHIYHHDSTSVARDVEAWVLERGKRPSYRIVVAGYEGEYRSLTEAGWRVEHWKAAGGYGNTARSGEETRGKKNRHRERLWFSPHCLNGGLFE